MDFIIGRCLLQELFIIHPSVPPARASHQHVTYCQFSHRMQWGMGRKTSIAEGNLPMFCTSNIILNCGQIAFMEDIG